MTPTRVRIEDWGREPRSDHACVVRYGGIGDMVQAASVFPLLREQGYKVVVNCHPNGADLLRGNPHVDEFLVQKRDQIPADELQDYWKGMSGCFGRFINLSESIERTLLAWPWDESYWKESRASRHARMNVNYLERTHDLSGVPHTFSRGFYPTEKEQELARKERHRLAGQRQVVMITLSGSSIHKAYPHWDAVIAWMMMNTDAIVLLVGDDYCRILENGWEKERRVKLRSGRWSIRQTLTMAEHCDLVIGTETGVMNAVGLLDMPKVVMLSHSSQENLTKHWKATTVLEPFMATCFPCHRMHFKSDTCKPPPEHPTSKLAWCAFSIDPPRVYEAIAPHLNTRAAA